ncbi:hypothetical protein [Treponema succinifaciens]|uniref:hypothetical protein n=1 Tax=Treponema succinifaciens TaxID=167 RepID=UPI003FCD9E5B|nr:MAG: hypothetical protein L6V90_10070 [Treponema succinifaciens]
MKMKILVVAMAMSLPFGMSLFAQSEMDEEKPAIEQKASSDIEILQTANSLAKYGYENNSASALIEAAEIIAQVPTQKLEATVEIQGEKSKDGKAASESGYTAEKLIEDAKKLAGKDKTFTNWIKKVEKLIKSSNTRGAVGGPKYQYSWAYGYNGKTQFSIPFYANSFAEIYVESIDYADLDLYVYDENWNLIARDTSYNMNCYVSFYPRWTGRFYVIVKNTSKWDSCFQIFTN